MACGLCTTPSANFNDPDAVTGQVAAVLNSPNVTWSSGTLFQQGTAGTFWNGDAISINGIAYTMSSVPDTSHLVLTSNFLQASGTYPYRFNRLTYCNATKAGYQAAFATDARKIN